MPPPRGRTVWIMMNDISSIYDTQLNRGKQSNNGGPDKQYEMI